MTYYYATILHDDGQRDLGHFKSHKIPIAAMPRIIEKLYGGKVERCERVAMSRPSIFTVDIDKIAIKEGLI